MPNYTVFASRSATRQKRFPVLKVKAESVIKIGRKGDIWQESA